MPVYFKIANTQKIMRKVSLRDMSIKEALSQLAGLLCAVLLRHLKR